MHSIPPMLVMLVPLLFVLSQLAARYEFRPLGKDEQTVVALQIKPDAWKMNRDVVLSSGEGFVVETEPLRDEKYFTIYWRVRAHGIQTEPLLWTFGDQTVSKSLPMSAAPEVLEVASPRRAGATVWDQILYPAEASLPANSPVATIDIGLSPRDNSLAGWKVPWWATFFLVSMLVAFVAGKFLGVQY